MQKNLGPKKVLIWGAGSFGEEILDCLDEINCIKPTYECVGFLDDDEQKWKSKHRGIPVLGSLSISKDFSNIQLISALTNNKNFWEREVLFSNIKKKPSQFETIIHPSAVISKTASIGEGTIILSNVTIGPNTKIGNYVVVLSNSVINHDVRVKSYSIITSGVNISGNTTIGSCCYLGSGSTIRENITIEDCCLIGMGGIILTNVSRNSVMVGNPAKKIRAVVET
jgi:sugar O-acyltransferase (sialic acid O-acetyltransferase NeuD family)